MRKCAFVIAFIVAFLLPSLASAGQGETVWGVCPNGAEQTIASFYQVGARTTGQCAVAQIYDDGSNMSGGGSCANYPALHYVSNDWAATYASIVVLATPWETTEGCNIKLQFAGTPTITFAVGVSGLAAVADASSSATFVNNLLSAGDTITVKHDTPTAGNCIQGDSCTCTGGSASYYIRIYGCRQ